MERATEGFRARANEPIADEFRNRVVGEESGKAPDGERHQDEITDADIAEKCSGHREVPDTYRKKCDKE